MKRVLVIAAAVALVVGVCVAVFGDRGRGKAVIHFVSATNEVGFDVITFTISNRSSVPVSAVCGVQWRASNTWVNVSDESFHHRYQLEPGESSTIDVPWRDDLYSWRVHASVRPGASAFDRWRSRMAFRFRRNPRVLKWLSPTVFKPQEAAEGPEMRMKRPCS